MDTLVLEVFGPLIAAFVLLVAVRGARRLFHGIRERPTPEELQAARDTFRRRLLHPKPEEVEQDLGGRLPERLLTLYQDQQTLLSEELEVRRPNGAGEDSTEWIEAFLPLDLESQRLTIEVSEHGRGKGFCFATDGTDSFYWVPASATRQPDAPVFFVRREPFGSEQIAESLDEFLSWPRSTHEDADSAPGA